MINESDLVKGVRVEWKSQAGGRWLKKRGIIVAHVPKREPIQVSLLEGEAPRVHGILCSNVVDRYLIKLESRGTKTTKFKTTHYYVPVASVVRKGRVIADEPSADSKVDPMLDFET